MWQHLRRMKLTAEAFERAAAFVVENARELEVARFAVHFEEGSPDEVDEELRAYRNADGGFGRGLEPDFYCEESCAAATVAALKILSETGAPPDSDLVVGAVEYLLATYDPEVRGWRKVPPSVNDFPHAEWWHHPEGEGASDDPAFWALTNVDAIAYLHDYPMRVPSAWLEEITREALTRLALLADEMKMHVYASYERLVRRLDAQRGAAVVSKLAAAAAVIVDKNPDNWAAFVATPLWIAPTPASPLLSLLPFDVDTNLDYEIVNQRRDGSWRPRWRWREDPEGWAEAEQEWAGIVTLETLLQLRDFGRLEAY
jgi:hypothetical protein